MTSTETVRTISRDGCPKTATSAFTQLLSSVRVVCPELCSSCVSWALFELCVLSSVRVVCPELCSSCVSWALFELCVLSSVRVVCPELCSSSMLLLRPQRPYGLLLGTGRPGRPPRLSHNSGALGNERMGRLYIYSQVSRSIDNDCRYRL